MGARWMSRSAAAIVAVVVWFGVFAGGAFAASVSLCVPSTAGQSVSSGACSGSGSTVALPASSADQQTLISILPHITFSSSGVGGKPTVKFTGVNLQLVDGAGSTSSVNGTGNLVLGYDENPAARAQTGSHDLVLGQRQSFTGYSEVLNGYNDTASGAYASVFGVNDTASGSYASVLGVNNTASGAYATVSGGDFNVAKTTAASVSGGLRNTAAGSFTSVAGGCSNIAGPGTVSINTNCTNTTSFPNGFASVTGGAGNQATGINSSVTGGVQNGAQDPFASITGGCGNLVCV
jgi:hypothetical protein